MHSSLGGKNARRWLLACLLTSILVFWLSASRVSSDGMALWEIKAFDAMYNLPAAWQPFWLVVTLAGSVFMAMLIAGILLLLRQRLSAVRLLLLSGTTLALAWLAKLYFARPRPDVLLDYVTQRGPYEADFGFPSAHAALAAALAIGLLPLVPRRYWVLLLAAAVLVGLSRIYLGVHSPLDIVGGWALGTAVSAGYLLIISARRPIKRDTKSRKNKAV